jgi:glycosyltransferase involved in cell wall biosynthesis
MACGVPVVVTDLPGPRRLVENGDAGLVVPPGDPVGLAAAVAHLLAERATREGLSERGLRRAQACDELAVAQDLLAWAGCGSQPSPAPGGTAHRADVGPALCTR